MSRPRHMLRVIKGGFAPADNYTADALRARGYRIGDIVFIKTQRESVEWL